VGFVAPAGTPLSLSDLARGAARSASSATIVQLRRGLSAAGGRQRAWLASTGRAAMTLALTAMKRASGDPRRIEVVFPGYTCYSVPASVQRAGLVPRICDVDPATLSPNFDSLAGVDLSRVLAIVSANLYGVPNALEEMESLAHPAGLFMVDDAAQALGARYRDRPVGNFGDVGLYSFDKGKNITTLQGGVLLADAGRFANELDAVMNELRGVRPTGIPATLAKLPVYALLLRPWAYGLVRHLPIGLGLTPWDVDYPLQPYSPALAGFAAVQLDRLTEINDTRVRNAERLRAALADVPGVTLPRVLPGAVPVYARFPMLVDADRRADVIARLERAGIGATASYPRALIDAPEVAARLPADQRPTPGAREVANRIVTLPTHGYAPPNMAARVREALLRI
jgi:dTDP-4-amino-4,6-dideoxygalactose transaminase